MNEKSIDLSTRPTEELKNAESLINLQSENEELKEEILQLQMEQSLKIQKYEREIADLKKVINENLTDKYKIDESKDQKAVPQKSIDQVNYLIGYLNDTKNKVTSGSEIE